VFMAAAAGVVASTASAVPEDACGLLPASTIARDFKLSHVVESAASTPDTESGGRLTRCGVTVWKGSKSKAKIAAGGRAELNIETTEEDTGSPFAGNWAKSGARDTRSAQEGMLEEESMFGSGYYTRSNVGYALWDRKNAEALTFNTTQNGIRNIFATWHASKRVGRTVTLNMYVDEREHGFAEINKLAKSAVSAFAISPGEFGSPGPPAPEPKALTPVQRFHPCPGAKARGHGETYEHFEVKGGVSCGRAVGLMRTFLAEGSAMDSADRDIQGWNLEVDHESSQVTGSKGHAQFICVPDENLP
jgi:hypothetical protein